MTIHYPSGTHDSPDTPLRVTGYEALAHIPERGEFVEFTLTLNRPVNAYEAETARILYGDDNDLPQLNYGADRIRIVSKPQQIAAQVAAVRKAVLSIGFESGALEDRGTYMVDEAESILSEIDFDE
jgi:hypothetical protein